MMLLETFPPTRQAALKRVSTVRPSDYGQLCRARAQGALAARSGLALRPRASHGLKSASDLLAARQAPAW